MEIDHLSSSEIEIECNVRNISGTPNVKHASLREKVQKEIAGTSEIPVQCHDDAIIRPRKLKFVQKN